MNYINSKYLYILISAAIFAAIGLAFWFSPAVSIPNENEKNPDIARSGGENNATTSPDQENSAPDENQIDSENSSGEISILSIKNCFAKEGATGECLDALFRPFLQIHSTIEALALVEKFGNEDAGFRVACHPVVHAVGRETFLKTKTVHDSFAACDQTCHSGCYHGAMERFLRGDAAHDDDHGHISKEELHEKARAACDSSLALRFRFQCLHGLGHALMFFSDYALEDSLAACDSIPDRWSQSSCYGGVFMENVFSATPEKRDLSKTDAHYPCSKLDETYKPDCYLMQTTRMTEMGLSTEKLFEECGNAGTNKNICIQSIGRDLSNQVRFGSVRETAAKCEMVSGEERQFCTRGIIFALIDNTWDGKYAFPFCDSFLSEEDKKFCFDSGADYMRITFEKTAGNIEADCVKYLPQNKEFCVENTKI